MVRKGAEKGKPGDGRTRDSDDFDDPSRPADGYNCIGKFHEDFAELCLRAQIDPAPEVVLRPKIALVQQHAHHAKDENKPEKVKGGRGKGTVLEKEAPEVEEANKENEGEPTEPPPKTYTLKDKYEYFKPCVQVEMDNPDKHDTVTEIFVRGWKIDQAMMDNFSQCLPVLERLHTITLWNVNLCAETVATLADFLPNCANVKTLNLDATPVPEQNYHLLINDMSNLTNLSLRSNRIDRLGCKLIGEQLGSVDRFNQKLLTLNLTSNLIDDEAVKFLAKGLRTNRTLLVLTLQNNQISDAGAGALAEVLSKFTLTHEEIVQRRRLLSLRDAATRQKSHTLRVQMMMMRMLRARRQRAMQKLKEQKRAGGCGLRKPSVMPSPTRSARPSASQAAGIPRGSRTPVDSVDEPPPSRRGAASGDRPASTRSGGADKKVRDKSSKQKKQQEGKKEEKEDPKKKKDDKQKKPEPVRAASKADGPGKASTVSESKVTAKGKDKVKGKEKGKGNLLGDRDTPDLGDSVSPLLEVAEPIDGTLIIPGNRCLISLNLRRNQIGQRGMESFMKALHYQQNMCIFKVSGGTGLMRLELMKNRVDPGSEILRKIQDYMTTRDPLNKTLQKTPEPTEKLPTNEKMSKTK